VAKAIGAKDEQIQDNLQAVVGDTGTALSLMMLVAALEEAKPGDKILVLSYGSGSDALYFEVTSAIAKLGSRKGIRVTCPRETISRPTENTWSSETSYRWRWVSAASRSRRRP